MATSIWPTVHAERAALAADLDGLDDERWSTPSLCEGWSVRDVLAHMAATAKISPLSFFPKLVGSGFSLSRMQEKDLAHERGPSPGDTLAGFRDVVTSTKHPPGPTVTWLGETVVHAEDIRRPLGMAHSYPVDALVQVADSYKRSNLVMGSKRRIEGVALRATDTDWSNGDGPEASGPMLSLLLVIAGREAGLADLEGDGVATLASRWG
jgi:uncharacterized protein (TIGR03083 family)